MILQPRHINRNIFVSIDWFTIALYLILLIWGWFSVCGACYDFNHPDVFAWNTNSGKQMVWIASSVVLSGILMLTEKKFYYKASDVLFIIMLSLLVITIFIAPDTKGSRSWIPIGSVKLQPAELAKFTVALALAKYMDRYGFSLDKRKDFLTVLGIICAPILFIIMERETGSAMVYTAFFLVLYREGMTGSVLFAAFAFITYFVIGIKFGDDVFECMPASVGEFWVLLLAYVFSAGMLLIYMNDVLDAHKRKIIFKAVVFYGIGVQLLAWMFSYYVIPFNFCVVQIVLNISLILFIIYLTIITHVQRFILIAGFAIVSTCTYFACDYVFDNILQDHQRTRIEVLLGKKDDPRGAGYNVNQAKIAIGSGGLWGKGFLQGTQTKLRYVPEQDTDFIFCTVGEEEGFVGAVGVLIVYLIFILRLFALSERQTDTMGRVYGYSVACIFLFHLFVNVGMVLGLTPVIGIPLPFFSYGGSSLWGFTILLFIFLRMDAERNLKQSN